MLLYAKYPVFDLKNESLYLNFKNSTIFSHRVKYIYYTYFVFEFTIFVKCSFTTCTQTVLLFDTYIEVVVKIYVM